MVPTGVKQPHENRGTEVVDLEIEDATQEWKQGNMHTPVVPRCHSTAALQHITTDCRRQDKQEITEDAQTESEKHITQPHLAK
jgi:hypothetical protein